MRLEIEYGPHAANDLYYIWLYASNDKPIAADGLLARLNEIFGELAAHPGLGRSRDDLLPGLRSFPHGRYVVFYQVHDRSLRILRILNAARDITSNLFE
jgi:toxin ParE1/3/4